MDGLAHKPAYKVNLIRQHYICESNYHKLLKLLPALSKKDNHSFKVSHGIHQGVMCFQVIDRAKYTTVIRLSFQADWNQWLSVPTMSVRLYHDARMAEVISAQKLRHFQSVYDYPNEKMLQPDEKEQLNRFLSDWLNFCFSAGHAQFKLF